MISMAKKQRAPGRQANGVASENVGSGPDRTLALSMDEVLSVTGTDVRLDKSATRAQNGRSIKADVLRSMLTTFRRSIKLSNRHRHFFGLARTGARLAEVGRRRFVP
jgi:hypothetical protein